MKTEGAGIADKDLTEIMFCTLAVTDI